MKLKNKYLKFKLFSFFKIDLKFNINKKIKNIYFLRI